MCIRDRRNGIVMLKKHYDTMKLLLINVKHLFSTFANKTKITMYKFSSRQVVFFLSFLLTLVAGLGWTVILLSNDMLILFSVLALFIFFISAHFLIQFALNKFILEKIRPIYKIIDYVPQKGKEAKLKLKPDFLSLIHISEP